MKNLYYHIDDEKVISGEGRSFTYFIGGWACGSDGRQVEFTAEDGRGSRIPCRVEHVPRKDAEKSLRENKIPVQCDAGIRIFIELDRAFFRTEKELKIIAHTEESGDEVFIARTVPHLAHRYFRLGSSVDGWMESSEEYSVTGWAYCRLSAVTVTVTGRDGKNVPVKIEWKRRLDVENALGIDDKMKTGFTLRMKKEDVQDPRVTVHFAAGHQKCEERINLSKNPGGSPAAQFLKRMARRSTWEEFSANLKKEGFAAALRKLGNPERTMDEVYELWFRANRVTEEELERQRSVRFAHGPKISIVIPLYNTRLEFLAALMDSITGQSYADWELCLADGSTDDSVGEFIKTHYGKDPRIVYSRLEENLGIAGNTNAALAMATGDFIMLTDHDDLLEKDALFEIARVIDEDPETDILYTDEDLTDEKGEHFYSPRFKPDFNPDFLASINYICHIFVVRRTILEKTGGFRKEYDGAQDWDLILRCTELSDHIRHIPRILYHWRAYGESTAGNQDSKRYAIDNARDALQAHFERIGEEAELEYTDIFILYRAHLKVQGTPKVSIVICTKDQKDTLKTCVDSIYGKTTYQNFEVILVENNSTEQETFDYYKELEAEHDNLKVVKFEGAFNYSKVNNFGAQFATGQYLLFLNNDTELITPDWLERMIGFCQRENTGIVGAKLLYDDDTVQHCGVVIGVGGFAGHVLTGENGDEAGEFGRLQAIQDVSAVTGACLMIDAEVFRSVGGFDEDLTVALNDVDLCMKVRARGLRVVLDPSVQLHHFESKSRGYEETEEKHERFKREIRIFRGKWKKELEAGDPYYNPNLTLMYGDCHLKRDNEHFDIIDEIESEDRDR